MKITLTRKFAPGSLKVVWELRTQDGGADPVYIKSYPVEYKDGCRTVNADVLDDLALLQYAGANTVEIKREA